MIRSHVGNIELIKLSKTAFLCSRKVPASIVLKCYDWAIEQRENGIEVRFQNETIWLSQKMMAVLFDCSADNISLHLKNIFKTNELNN